MDVGRHFTSVCQTFPNIILEKYEMFGNVIETFGVTRASNINRLLEQSYLYLVAKEKKASPLQY